MKLGYGNGSVEFDPPEAVGWRVLPPGSGAGDVSPGPGVVGRAVRDLAAQLDEAGLGPGARLLLIVPDHTRRCRLEAVLPPLLAELERRRFAPARILVANGTHAALPEAAVRQLVTEEVFSRCSVAQHDDRNPASLVRLGETSRGTPVVLNSAVAEADFILTISGTLFHYFAGFGGGPKMLLPGVASREATLANHRRTIDPGTGRIVPECREGNTATNPVWLDLAEALGLVPRVLSLQVVLDARGEIAWAEAGPVLPVHARACEEVRRLYGVPVARKADVVVASAGGHPADVNLIQSHKSIHHAVQALKPGGCLILLARCAGGIGSASFMPYFEEKSAAGIASRLLRDYQINGHTALALRTKTEQATIVLVSDLDPAIVRSTGMVPARDLREAWSLVSPRLPAGAAGYVIPTASVHVPFAHLQETP